MFRKVIAQLFDLRMRDHDHVIVVYRRHNETVRRTFPAERLLVYDVAEGWAPLCGFLGVAVPNAPMPRLNTTEDWARMRKGPPRDEITGSETTGSEVLLRRKYL
jgi:hypothetical protein